MGMTDKFQGTGVYRGIKMERSPKASEADSESVSLVKGKKSDAEEKTSGNSQAGKK